MLRRLVLSMLFLVLPLQFVWAAAAPYCAHETKPAAARHFGHHEHKHQADDQAKPAADKADDTAGAYHADCENCHLSSGAMLPIISAVPATAPTDAGLAYHPPLYRSHIPPIIERPDIAELTPAARFGGGVVSGAVSLD